VLFAYVRPDFRIPLIFSQGIGWGTESTFLKQQQNQDTFLLEANNNSIMKVRLLCKHQKVWLLVWTPVFLLDATFMFELSSSEESKWNIEVLVFRNVRIIIWRIIKSPDSSILRNKINCKKLEQLIVFNVFRRVNSRGQKFHSIREIYRATGSESNLSHIFKR
jgi:hypothetical protein